MKSGCHLICSPRRQQVVAVREGRHEPLTRRDDLEGALALLVELDRVRDRAQLADQRAALAQRVDHGGAHLIHVATLESGRRSRSRPPASRVGQFVAAEVRGQESPVATDEGARGQRELAPPGDVGGVAEGADHGDARTLLGIGEFVGQHGHLDVKERRHDRGAEERLVALVVGMRDEGHATREEFGTGRLDLDGPVAVGAGEGDAVVVGGTLAVLELGLGDGGAKVDVPQGRRLASSRPRRARASR